METLLAPRFLMLYALVASALFVHLRGRVRHRFRRQLTDHSTFLAPYNALVYLFSAVPAKPFLDLDASPDLALLRDNWETFRDEARHLFEAGHIRAAAGHDDLAFNTFFQRGWTRFYLKWYGDFLPSARQLCPRSVDLVRSIPSVHAALFAVLPPHSRLGAHRDPFAGSLRYHLGLVTPNSDRCRIYVDGRAYAWRDGEAVLFDETYIHRAVNETDEARIILFCDVARPIRNRAFAAVNRFVTRRLARATASRNLPDEPIGFLNHGARAVHAAGGFFRRLKKRNKRVYYAAKYAVLGALAWVLFVRGTV